MAAVSDEMDKQQFSFRYTRTCALAVLTQKHHKNWANALQVKTLGDHGSQRFFAYAGYSSR